MAVIADIATILIGLGVGGSLVVFVLGVRRGLARREGRR